MPLFIPSKAPNLQVPPQQYDYNQQQLLVNQLKLYFSQVDPLNTSLIQQAQTQAVLQWLG